MRFRSTNASGTVAAVCGTNTVSFGLFPTDAVKDGLLGFAVERIDPVNDERYYLPGFKVFRSVFPNPLPGLYVSTFEQPVQSFVWDDFTAEADHAYEYHFRPLKGRAKHLFRNTAALTIEVRTEPLATAGGHDVFFNRGVASSQMYERDFGSTPIAELAPDLRDRALAWLSRDLGTALLRFIDSVPAGEQLLGCFYEFHYPPALDRLKTAVDRGVDVKVIVEAKVNEFTDSEGIFHESFPREANRKAIADAGLPSSRIILRQARRSAIAHNKFMVRVTSAGPSEVWTGSTNLSQGAVSGQTNVGHWLRDPAVASAFANYWTLLSGDPGNPGPDSTAGRALNTTFRADVAALSPAPADLRSLPTGTTALFSPRPNDSVLDAYAALLDSAAELGCITFAFGITAPFRSALQDNTPADAIIFMMLEKKDQPAATGLHAAVRLKASNNVYEAWGSFLRDPVYQWAKETNAGQLGLNTHVSYIHSKFLLIDPLGADPIVVTGSANFSTASTDTNDENMIVVRGDRRVADIYWTEFNRLFNHYYFRSVVESLGTRATDDSGSLFLVEDASWQDNYAPGKLRAKRLALFADMVR